MTEKINIDEILLNVKSVGISGHVNPDGDCMGSTLGLYNYISNNYPDIKLDLFINGEIPEVFRFLSGAENGISPKKVHGEAYDVFFVLDCSDVDRIGETGKIFKNAKLKVCIDHHISNDAFADINYILPNASSTSELIASLIDKDKINKAIAECLYTGIVHDTGVFQYQSTSRKTMETAGMLMEKGIDYSRIIEYTYYEKTYNQNRLMALAILNSRLYDKNRIIATVISKVDFKACNADKSDTEGIVNQLRITRGCDISIFLYENEDGTHKLSLRSTKDIDVAEIAKGLGGGGHIRAAGATVGKKPWEEIEKLVEIIISKR